MSRHLTIAIAAAAALMAAQARAQNLDEILAAQRNLGPLLSQRGMEFLTDQTEAAAQKVDDRALGFSVAFADDEITKSHAAPGGSHPGFERTRYYAGNLFGEQNVEIRQYPRPISNPRAEIAAALADAAVKDTPAGEPRAVSGPGWSGQELGFRSGRRVVAIARGARVYLVDSGDGSKAKNDAFIASFALRP